MTILLIIYGHKGCFYAFKIIRAEIKNIAFHDNNTLEQDGQEKVNLGLTTEEELRRVLQEKN